MKPLKVLMVGCLVLTLFAFMPALITPVHAAESVTCPTEVNLNPGQTVTVNCTATWSAGDGSAQSATVNCSTGFVCTGWTIGPTVSPASYGSGLKAGSQGLSFDITAPSAATCNANNDCVTQIEIDTTGGGFGGVGTIAARATITITAPEFGIGVASAVAAGFVVLAFFRKKQAHNSPMASLP